jgi:hypothetical protein
MELVEVFKSQSFKVKIKGEGPDSRCSKVVSERN